MAKKPRQRTADQLLAQLQIPALVAGKKKSAAKPTKKKPAVPAGSEVSLETEFCLSGSTGHCRPVVVRIPDEIEQAFRRVDPIASTPAPTPAELLQAAAEPVDPLKKWIPGPDWHPSPIEAQMFTRWASGAQYLQITIDPEANPQRYGLPEVIKIIKAVDRYYNDRYAEFHGQIKRKSLAVLEAASSMCLDIFHRSCQDKIETITEHDGKVTTKRTGRDGDIGALKAVVDIQERILKICSEISSNSDEDKLIPSGLGRPREEVAAEFLQRFQKRLAMG